MNTLGYFLAEIAITLLVCLLTIAYLRPVMIKLLTDLCGTEDRAKFWTTFANILLLALPLISSLGYAPAIISNSEAIYGIAHQLRNNFFNFVLGLALIGFVLLLFTASASKTHRQSRQTPEE